MISLEKWKILTPLQKLPKNMGDWGKLIVAKGFKTCQKSNKSPNLVTLNVYSFILSSTQVWNFQNMFLAIINDTYTEVKEEIQYQQNDFEISDYVKRGVNNAMGIVGSRDMAIDIENAIRLAGIDGVVTYDEVRQNLKK